jgi:hypothetical protein
VHAAAEFESVIVAAPLPEPDLADVTETGVPFSASIWLARGVQ